MKRLLGVVVVLALAGCTQQGASPPASGALPDSAVKQIEALLKEKDSRTPAQRKIASQLLYARNGMPAGIEWKLSDQVQSTAQVDAKGRYLVDIRGDLAVRAVPATGAQQRAGAELVFPSRELRVQGAGIRRRDGHRVGGRNRCLEQVLPRIGFSGCIRD